MKNYKFALAADIHYDLFQNLTLLRDDMLTDRADEIDMVFKAVIDSVLDVKIERLFILGDLLHRRNIRSDAINALVYNRLKYAKEKGLKVILIIGNHDQAHIAGNVHAFSLMTDVIEVIDTPKILVYGGIDFLCLPYEEYRGSEKSLELLLKKSKNPNKILLGHIGIQDTQLSGFDHISKEPISVKDLHLDKFIGGYFGHYHFPQKIGKNAYYIGSPCQHSLSDIACDRGYMQVEIGIVKGKSIASSKMVTIDSPKFYEVNADDYNPSNYHGKNYIKILGCNRKQVADLQNDSNVMATTGENLVQVVDKDKVISSSLSWDEMVARYVKLTETDKKKQKRLIIIGKELLV